MTEKPLVPGESVEINLSETTPPWKSKTLWVSVFVAIAPAIPGVGGLIAANPEIAAMIVGAIFSVLRFTTKKPIGA